MNAGLDELRGDRTRKLNDAVSNFQKEFHATMKHRGYVRKTSVQSALYNWEYTKGTRRITIDGWHSNGTPGTCRYFGPTKSFFDLFDNIQVPAYKAVVKANSVATNGKTLDDLYEDQFRAMKEALEYIDRKA